MDIDEAMQRVTDFIFSANILPWVFFITSTLALTLLAAVFYEWVVEVQDRRRERFGAKEGTWQTRSLDRLSGLVEMVVWWLWPPRPRAPGWTLPILAGGTWANTVIAFSQGDRRWAIAGTLASVGLTLLFLQRRWRWAKWMSTQDVRIQARTEASNERYTAVYTALQDESKAPEPVEEPKIEPSSLRVAPLPRFKAPT
jgi:hypothetical protein